MEGPRFKYYSAPLPPFMTESLLCDMITECSIYEVYTPLTRILVGIFGSIEKLSKSFSLKSINNSDSSNIESDEQLEESNQEELLSQKVFKDQGDDSCATSSNNWVTVLNIDLQSLRRTYDALFKLDPVIFEESLKDALLQLASNLEEELGTRSATGNYDDILKVLLIVFEMPTAGTNDLLEVALPEICKASEMLPVEVQAALSRIWADLETAPMENILENLHLVLDIRIAQSPYQRIFIHKDHAITSTTKVLKILYYANILAGVRESPKLIKTDEMEDSLDKLTASMAQEDPLAKALGIHIIDCRKPLLPFSRFYNVHLSNMVGMVNDFTNFKRKEKFCFLNYPFILTPATKSLGLNFHNRIKMMEHGEVSLLLRAAGQPSSPYLRLRVRRDYIVHDALLELEMISTTNPSNFKKQLVVEFEEEQGIDEGGLSKEFFQLIIEEILNPNYALFTIQKETQTIWFNPIGFKSIAQFILIGHVFGLAIYNNVILAVHFPIVLYRKLMGRKGSFEDLLDWDPVLYNSLKQMLEYTEPDLDDVFLQTFRIGYQDVFGVVRHHDLVNEGGILPVTQDNKYEFVNLYADFLLNKSVDNQFRAFQKGFQMVLGDSPLEQIFRPDEIELVVCGSKNYDFDELEGATKYNGGYTNKSQIIKDFWTLVHAFSLEDKRKLLQFTTGSDRIPLGGLRQLRLVITRNGPDTDRLPTAQTCYRILLLPEYSTIEKLKSRLEIAINYSKGFGLS